TLIRMDEANPPKPHREEETTMPNGDKHSSEKAGELIQELLRGMVERRASDLHIRSGTNAIYRIDGNLLPVDERVINPDLAKEMLGYMISVRQKKIFEARNEVDFSFAVPGVGRFRGNAFRQRGSVAVVLRQIPTKIPTFEDLSLPRVIPKFCQLNRGLVLVC